MGQSLSDNRLWEWLCYTLVILLVVVGVSTLFVGIIKEKEVIAATGGGVTGLFWPALRYASAFRKDNIRIRLYELALAKAKTSDEIAAVLCDALGQSATNSPKEKTE